MRGLEAGLLTFLIYLAVQAAVLRWTMVTRRASTLVGLWILGLPGYAVIYALMPDDAAIWPSMLTAPSDLVTWFCGSLLYFFLFMGYAAIFEGFGKLGI